VKRLIALTIAALVAAVAIALGVSTSTNAVAIPTPTGTQLAGFGVSFTPAHASVAGGSSNSALATAGQSTGLTALQATYQYCSDPNVHPAIAQDCWVVVMQPGQHFPGAPGEPDPKPATWSLVLVDPSSGNVLERLAANN